MIDTQTRSLLEKYAPWLLVLLTVMLAGRIFRKAFWSLFGMYWVLHATHMFH